MSSAKLELLNLNKGYGKKNVINNLSLKVESGEFFVILGPSGEGKSTLLRIMAGIENPDSGQVIIDGKDITHLSPNRRNIAMVFQSYALYPNMSVRGNISFPLKMKHMSSSDIQKKVAEAAKILNISEVLDKRITKISGGQKQRVALARAIVRDPSLFLLDEPLSNLDARTRFTARGELKRIQRELGQTFVYVTHDQKEAASLGDRVGVLHQGGFEQIAPFQELYDNPKTQWIGDFVGDFPMSFLPPEALHLEGSGQVGFRPEWARLSKDSSGVQATVESIERAGDAYYVFCKLRDSYAVTLKSNEEQEVGSEISFIVERYNSYETPTSKNAPLVN